MPSQADEAAVFQRGCALQEALMEERGKVQQRLVDEEKEGAGADGGPGSEGEAVEEVQEDPLDAFMTNVTVQLEQSKVSNRISFPFSLYCAVGAEQGAHQDHLPYLWDRLEVSLGPQ